MSPSIESFPIQKLDTLLAESLGNNIQIKHVEWKLLNAPGENYGSDMLAINVIVTRSSNNTEETLDLVAKLPPTSAFLLDLFNSPVSFKKEIQFYNSMAKEFMKLQIESGINDPQLVPKFFGGRLGLKPDKFDGQAVILLENLKCNGYITEDRIFGLDKKHTEFAVKRLARMHALVIALKLKKPQLYKNITTELLVEIVNETTENCLNDMMQKILFDLQNMEEIKPYIDSIKKSIEYCKENQNSKEVEEPWGTMIHNDFWVNNMMFKHDEQGEIVDMKIVDFQLNIYDYGVKDLIFFLISSANKDTLDNNLDYMLDLYYSSFIKDLKTLNIDISKFPKQKFDEIVNHCGILKLNQCLMMTQVIQAPRTNKNLDTKLNTKITNFDTEMKPDEIFKDQSDNVIYKQKLSYIVILFHKKGWLLK